MSLSDFNEIVSNSNQELGEKIVEAENELFNLRFKKATRQNIKSHQIKHTKRNLAQLKTLLNSRLKNLKKQE